MTPEGRIAIDLFPADGAVKIASTRPLTITRQFSGHSPEGVIRSVSLLFATCRDAQSIASAEAFENALGLEPPESTRKARALLVLAETAREHALRILMDWPQFLRAPQEPPALRLQTLMHIDRDLRRSLAERNGAIRINGVCAIETDGAKSAIAKLRALLEQAIFGEDLDRWQAKQSFPVRRPTVLPPHQASGEAGRHPLPQGDRVCAGVPSPLAGEGQGEGFHWGGRESLLRSSEQDLRQWAHAGQTAAQRLLYQVFDDGLSTAGSAQLSALPPLEPASLAERLFAEDAEAFIAEPEWEGLPRETSPLTRSADHPLIAALRTEGGFGLVARLAACLTELSRIPAQMLDILDALDEGTQQQAHPLQRDGFGVGQVEAARGRLAHAVELVGEKVSRYRILAPTEWNFHPEGAATRGLARIAECGGEHRADIARLFVTAVDPCVGVDVRVC